MSEVEQFEINCSPVSNKEKKPQNKINLIGLNLKLSCNLYGIHVSDSLVSDSFPTIHGYFWGLLKGIFHRNIWTYK